MQLTTFYQLAQQPLPSPFRFTLSYAATVKASPFLAATGYQATHQKVTFKTTQLTPITQPNWRF